MLNNFALCCCSGYLNKYSVMLIVIIIVTQGVDIFLFYLSNQDVDIFLFSLNHTTVYPSFGRIYKTSLINKLY